MAMYHQSPHVRTESEVSTPGNIWKDTSEAELYGNYLDNNNQDNMQLRPTMGGRSTMTMGALGSERGGAGAGGHPDITVGLLEDENDAARNKTKAYSGRKRVWPGALFLLLMVIGGSGAITYFGVKTFNAAQDQQQLSEDFNSPIIAVTPTLKVCRVPNYVTTGTKLYATADTDKHEVHFTGINWSGMENVEGVPHGLAVGQSKLETIAKKLAAMNINAVRLPLNAKMIIDDSKPDTTRFVSRSQTDLFGVSTYMEMIKKIVQGLARQQIAVLLDLHKIDPAYNASTSEKLWYTADYPEKTIIAMFKKLATSLCNEQHYNIIGIDIKNEPVDGCWPAKDTDAYCPPERNWPRAVERIAAGILEVCPNWLIVVEGLGANALSGTFNGVKATYSDWFGASLQNATKNPIVLPVKNKVVYAPHFYSPSVYPSAYFFEKQSSEGDSVSVTEYPNTPAGTTSLQAAVKQVLDNAFGEVLSTGTAPVFYGEFGGIYGVKELLAGKTSTRTIDYLIQYADAAGMIGGFSWSLNPDSIYDFNDVYSPKKPFQFGLYADSKWDEYNTDYAKGLTALKGNGIIPCFARTVLGSSAGSTAGTATVGNTTVGNTTKKNATAPATTPTTATNTTKLLL